MAGARSRRAFRRLAGDRASTRRPPTATSSSTAALAAHFGEPAEFDAWLVRGAARSGPRRRALGIEHLRSLRPYCIGHDRVAAQRLLAGLELGVDRQRRASEARLVRAAVTPIGRACSPSSHAAIGSWCAPSTSPTRSGTSDTTVQRMTLEGYRLASGARDRRGSRRRFELDHDRHRRGDAGRRDRRGVGRRRRRRAAWWWFARRPRSCTFAGRTGGSSPLEIPTVSR